MAKKSVNFSLPYDVDEVNALFSELPKTSKDCYNLIVHNYDKSKLYSSAYNNNKIKTSNLDVLVRPADFDKLQFGKLHGKNTYGHILPHAHNLSMSVAVSIPNGVPFAVFTDVADSEQGIETKQFTVFDKDHKLVNVYDANDHKNFEKLDSKFRPCLTDTVTTLKFMYFASVGTELLNKIKTDGRKYSNSDIKNNYYIRYATSDTVMKTFMPEFNAINVFDVNDADHQKLHFRSLAVIDSETERYRELHDERNSIMKTDVDAIQKNATAYKNYDAVVTERCKKENEIFRDHKVTFSDISRQLDDEFSITGITNKDINAIESKVSDMGYSVRKVSSKSKTVDVNKIVNSGKAIDGSNQSEFENQKDD